MGKQQIAFSEEATSCRAVLTLPTVRYEQRLF